MQTPGLFECSPQLVSSLPCWQSSMASHGTPELEQVFMWFLSSSSLQDSPLQSLSWWSLDSESDCTLGPYRTDWEWMGFTHRQTWWFVLIVINLQMHYLKFPYLRARWPIQWQQARKQQLHIQWDTWYSVHRTAASCYWHALMDMCDKMYLLFLDIYSS